MNGGWEKRDYRFRSVLFVFLMEMKLYANSYEADEEYRWGITPNWQFMWVECHDNEALSHREEREERKEKAKEIWYKDDFYDDIWRYLIRLWWVKIQYICKGKIFYTNKINREQRKTMHKLWMSIDESKAYELATS